MTEASLPRVDTPRRFQFDWVPAVLFRPRKTFAAIMSQTSGVWLTPILILTLTTLVRIAVSGLIGQAAAQAGEITLPPDSQWWTPEQQAQFMQAMQSTSGPVFVYVFPAISGLFGVWVGWLLVGGLLHLVLTLLGGRGDTRASINLVAWASLPFAVRDLVRIVSMLATDQLISSPGLAGFAPAGDTGWGLFLASFLKLVDVYVIWHILLLVTGVRSGNGLSRGKAIGGVLFTILLVLSLQSLIGFFTTRLGGMTIVRPFF